ncbi:hypothetical protein [Sphingomonas bacterium]|uniref:hypothetical protein n=1 Tax=Sphingomonas bacterium TaxID=1895847 RepID=UPI001576E65B|nr:hypothetical protein [Sphingomonas bacterium]
MRSRLVATAMFALFSNVLCIAAVSLSMSMPLKASRTIDDMDKKGRAEPVSQSKNSDVVVTAPREEHYPVTSKASSQFQEEAILARQANSEAQFFSRCIKAKDAPLLRQLVDSPPNSPIRSSALDRIVKNHSACYPGFNPISGASQNFFGDCNPRGSFQPVFDPKSHRLVRAVADRTICQAFFDRGAIVGKVIELYTQNLTLSVVQLNRADVVSRFRIREERFDKSRAKDERLFTTVVSCLVEAHPEVALQYSGSKANSSSETRLQRALIGLTPECVGGKKKVEVDPSVFRVFVTDAVYSWMIALRGTDSLIPPG